MEGAREADGERVIGPRRIYSARVLLDETERWVNGKISEEAKVDKSGVSMKLPNASWSMKPGFTTSSLVSVFDVSKSGSLTWKPLPTRSSCEIACQ